MTAVVAGGALLVAVDHWVADGATGDLVAMVEGAFTAVEAAVRP